MAIEKIDVEGVEEEIEREGIESDLKPLYDHAMLIGDKPYKTNRQLIRAFNIEKEYRKSKSLGKKILKEIDAWIKALEVLKDEAERISEEADKRIVTNREVLIKKHLGLKNHS